MTVFGKRRTSVVVVGNDVPSLLVSLNAAINSIGERLSQIEAYGQRPDFKGKVLLNVGNLKEVSLIDTSGYAGNELELANKVNEIINAFNVT